MLPVSKFNSVREPETRYLQRRFGKLVMSAFVELSCLRSFLLSMIASLPPCRSIIQVVLLFRNRLTVFQTKKPVIKRGVSRATGDIHECRRRRDAVPAAFSLMDRPRWKLCQ
jgi:hypothetical protein